MPASRDCDPVTTSCWSAQHQLMGSFDISAVYEGAVPMPTSRLFEAKAVNLVPRPKTSASHHRSRSSPSLHRANSSPSSPTTRGHQQAPRYDHDMARPGAPWTSEKHNHHHHNQKRGRIGSAGGESKRAGTSTNRQPSSSTTATAAATAPKWLSSHDWLSRSASAPSGVDPAFLEKVKPPSLAAHDDGSGHRHNAMIDRGECGNETMTTNTSSRNDSRGSPHPSRPNGPSVDQQRRTNNRNSETSSNYGGSSGSCVNSNNGSSGATRVSIAGSNDPEVLKVEIQRLQAALMNEFKGGSRFVGGAQFKASNSSRNSHGGANGGSCGGCLQVREALRRSREESRDLRGSLFRAEDVIKQLTLTKGGYQRGIQLYRNKSHHEMLRPSSSSALPTVGAATSAPTPPAPDEKDTDLFSNTERIGSATGSGSHARPSSGGQVKLLNSPSTAESVQNKNGMRQSRGDLLNRVQQLERELRSADFRDTRGVGAAVRAGNGHGRRTFLEDKINKYSNGHGGPPPSLPSGTPPLTSNGEATIESGSGSAGTCVRDWDDPLPPCSRCSTLNDRLLAEATKVNGLMRRIQDYQQESKRLQEELVGTEKAQAEVIDMRETVDQLQQQMEGQARAKEQAEKKKKTADEEIERLVADLDRWRTQAMEYDRQVRKTREEQKTLQEHLSQKEKLLQKADLDLAELRQSTNRTVEALQRQVARERAGLGEAKGALVAAKAARRRSESQAATADATHRRALKAALDSCVRLCVVAPTVNINIDDRRSSFCSGLPEEKIRAFVEDSVLPRFTRILLQPGSESELEPGSGSGSGSGSGPKGGLASTSLYNKIDCSCVEVPTTLDHLSARNAHHHAHSRYGSSTAPPSSSGVSTRRNSTKKTLPQAAGSVAIASVDNPALTSAEQYVADSKGESSGWVGRGDGGGNIGQNRSDFDKWLRELLVDMQTSIERHVANVFQTQTTASDVPGAGGGSGSGSLSLRR